MSRRNRVLTVVDFDLMGFRFQGQLQMNQTDAARRSLKALFQKAAASKSGRIKFANGLFSVIVSPIDVRGGYFPAEESQ